MSRRRGSHRRGVKHQPGPRMVIEIREEDVQRINDSDEAPEGWVVYCAEDGQLVAVRRGSGAHICFEDAESFVEWDDWEGLR